MTAEKKVIILLLLSVLSIVSTTNFFEFEHPFACDNKCALPITWDTPVTACGQDNNNYVNSMCNSTLATNLQCLLKNFGQPNPNVGISYPGPCGCPNNCVSGSNRGQCVSSACTCNPGWVGDCSLVTEGNACNGQGEVQTILNFETCVCNSDYALNDCSAIIGDLPPISQTIEPVVQYSDWDEYGNNNPIFNESTIAQIHLTMPPEFLDFQQDPNNRDNSVYLPVDMWFYNGVISETMNKVGFRIKGGASRSYVKKSFKLSFNEFEDGRKWYQQKKLELKAMQQDPSAVKEKLCLSLLYSMNAPAQRAAYTQLFINDQFMGIYLMIENIDDQFLKSRFGNEDGALYKCVGDLAYLGWDPVIYQNLTLGDSPAYEAETDVAETSYNLLRDFIFVINVTSDADFVTLLQGIFDVDLYLRTLAFEVLTGNWDGLWNGNNYYLYYNPQFNKFQYFRHDLEMSFGMWETLYPMSAQPVYSWGDGGRGYRLINRVLANEPFQSQFTQYCYDLMNDYFTLLDDSAFIQRMTYLNNELQPAIINDIWRQTDFGWSFDEFKNFPDVGITRTTSGIYPPSGYPTMSSMGLKEYMAARIASALEQLNPPSL